MVLLYVPFALERFTKDLYYIRLFAQTQHERE